MKAKIKVFEPWFETTSDRQHCFYRRVIEKINASAIPYLIGGGYALGLYLDSAREPKDLDIFLRRADVEAILTLLNEDGYKTELCFPHWLGKITCGEYCIDVIFSSGNGICEVDDVWFEHAIAGTVFNLPINICPPEEMIWTKAFVMERERYDGADVAHLLRACGKQIDWRRLLRRFEPHWRVLLSHLIL